MPKFTKAFVGSLKIPTTRQKITDVRQPGFSIRLEPSGNHRYLVTYTNKKTGKEAVRTLGKVKVMELDRAKETARRWQDCGGDPDAEDKGIGNPTLQEIINNYGQYLEEKHSPGAHDFVRRAELHLYPLIMPDTKAKDLSRNKLLEAFEAITRTCSKRMANTVIKDIRAAFNRAIFKFNMDDNGKLNVGNPAREIELHTILKRNRSFSKEQYRAIGLAFNESWEDGVDGMYGTAALYTLATMGLRKNEILTARRCNLDSSEDVKMKYNTVNQDFTVLTARIHKTSKTIGDKEIPIPAEVGIMLKNLLNKPGSQEWLFPGRVPGRPLTTLKSRFNKIKRIANEHLKKWGEETISMEAYGFTVHDLRKAFGSASIRIAKISVEQLQSVWDHQHKDTTEGYVSNDFNFKKEASDKASDAIHEVLGEIKFDPTTVKMSYRTKRRLTGPVSLFKQKAAQKRHEAA